VRAFLEFFAQCAAPAFTLLLAISAIAFRIRNKSAELHRRGSLVVAPKISPRRARRRRRHQPAHRLTLAGEAVYPEDECKHFKFVGTTGAGKSTAIRQLLSGALRRGDRAVIADPNGAYSASFHDSFRGDVVLNPFEKLSVRWEPFLEMHSAYDADELAASLIHLGEDPSSREWRGYARTFVAAILRKSRGTRSGNCGELWRLIALAPVDELRVLLLGTQAQAFLELENARMFSSIRSVTVSSIAAVEYVVSQRARPFSVREWVRRGKGVLFIPYSADQVASLRSIVAAWLRLAIFEALSGAESEEQRLWFVIDELDALGAIDGLKDALTRLRKFGGRCVLGFQAVSQVSNTYGAAEAQTIIENCGNSLLLRCSASEFGGTAQFASRLIGEREVLRRQTTRTRDRRSGLSRRDLRRSIQESDQPVTESAVLPSQLEQLPDLVGYLKLASSPVWKLISLCPDTSIWRSTTSA